jgi:hypothetical protein
MKAQKQPETANYEVQAILEIINSIKLFSTENIFLSPQFIRTTEKFDVVHRSDFKGWVLRPDIV